MTELTDFRDYLEWDVPAWKPALSLWHNVIHKYFNGNIVKGIEIGAHNGGVTLFFAERINGHILCTDAGGPTEKAKMLHEKFNIRDKVIYEDFNVLKPSYESGYFDFVVFKSLLGTVGDDFIGNFEKQVFTMKEIYRMLKPGG